MRFFALVSLLGLAVFSAFTQTTKPKKTGPPNMVKKAIAGKTSAVAKPKPAPQKRISPKNTPQTSAASKPKPKLTPKNPTSQKKTAQTYAASKPKPQPATISQKRPDEKAEWDKAWSIEDRTARIAALKKFIEKFPKSARQTDAFVLISTTQSEIGNETMTNGDIDGAAVLFKTAVASAPKPVPDQLWRNTLSKIPANLYFRGGREAAVEIAKILEEKSDTNAAQLLVIANFYISVENGSEAKRIAEKAIVLEPNSSNAHQTLGLASRIDFQLEQSAAAYAKALEFEPDSLSARRGLAEMKRSLGKAGEAVALYREILAKDDTNLPAKTGLILALFDDGKRSDAEAELARSLNENPGNVILLAGAAYWYASHNEADKAVEFAQKAVSTDPRFIWSHIALARGLLVQNKASEAEKVLLAARAYGNFPTLHYEIASARLAAGFYREAAEELAKSFSVKDGSIYANLGGRVPRESKNFSELIGFERRASIFAWTAADDPANADKLAALLEFQQTLDATQPDAAIAIKAADEFVGGNDNMKVHRQIFAAAQLLDKKVALPKVIELAKAAAGNIEAGLNTPNSTTAVMASELYENRAIAAARDTYLNVSNVPRLTLSAILRGRVEEINGWALYQMDNAAESAVRLKRAVSVLPVDSAWWRSSMWRLGSALALGGRETEALDAYVKCYKSGSPDVVRYAVIESLYRHVNGNIDGLDAKIGPNPAPPISSEAVAKNIEPSPKPEIIIEPPMVVKTEPTTTPTPMVKIDILPTAEPTPAVVVTDPPKTVPTPSPSPEDIKPPVVPETTPSPSPENIKPAVVPESTPSPTPEDIKPLVVPETTPSPSPEDIRPPVVPETTPSPALKPTPEISKANDKPNELFLPVIITIPPPDLPSTARNGTAVKSEPLPTSPETKPPDEPSSSPTPEKKPDVGGDAIDGRLRVVKVKPENTSEINRCVITVSDESLTLRKNGSPRAVIIGLEGDGDIDGITAVSSSPQNVSVRRELIEGVKTRALFVVGSISKKAGLYQIKFDLPCGKKEVFVKVQ